MKLFEAILGLPADVGRAASRHGQLCPAGAQGRPRDAGHEGLQPLQVWLWRRVGLAQLRQPLPPGKFLRPARRCSTPRSNGASPGVLIGEHRGRASGKSGRVSTGVWAEENTRASLFDAMYRKETFGVSGPHIKVRFFGGWEYGKDIAKAGDWVKQSYAGGVPMGAGCPPAMPAGGKGTAPKFVVWAVKDPTSGNLDRLQVIKGWTKNGQSFEKVFDVAWAGDRTPEKWSGRVPAIQSTVNIEKATYENSVGANELEAVWSDPEFSTPACTPFTTPASWRFPRRAGRSSKR